MGGAPVTSWKVGETIADFIQLKLPVNAPKGEYTLEAGLPESFNVLLKELQSLCLNIELVEGTGAPVAAED